jgi:hypothetical protein
VVREDDGWKIVLDTIQETPPKYPNVMVTKASE